MLTTDTDKIFMSKKKENKSTCQFLFGGVFGEAGENPVSINALSSPPVLIILLKIQGNIISKEEKSRHYFAR